MCRSYRNMETDSVHKQVRRDVFVSKIRRPRKQAQEGAERPQKLAVAAVLVPTGVAVQNIGCIIVYCFSGQSKIVLLCTM